MIQKSKQFVYEIYVGSNNKTKVVELDKIKDIMDSRAFYSYTIIKAQGNYLRESEDTIIIKIIGDKMTEYKILGLCDELREELEQIEILFSFYEIDLVSVSME